MFDVKMLDRLNFGQLGEALDQVMTRMDEVKDAAPDDEDNPQLDMLYVIANQIIERMDSIMRDYARSHPEVLDQWGPVMKAYKEGFTNYSDTCLKGGVPVLMVEPESPPQAPDAAAGARAEADKLVLDEKMLDGMNAGDLFEVNRLITEKVKQLNEELPEDAAEPLIRKLLDFSTLVIRRLDPLVREAYRDNPEQLAAWEAIIDYEVLDDEGEEDVQADVESSEVS